MRVVQREFEEGLPTGQGSVKVTMGKDCCEGMTSITPTLLNFDIYCKNIQTPDRVLAPFSLIDRPLVPSFPKPGEIQKIRAAENA